MKFYAEMDNKLKDNSKDKKEQEDNQKKKETLAEANGLSKNARILME